MKLCRICFTGLILLALAGRPGISEPKKYSTKAQLTLGRVAYLGDSITCGVGVRDREANRYSAVATGLLKAKDTNVVEVNLGRSGHALCQQAANYPQQVLNAKPDSVVIQWGVNEQFWGFSVAEFTVRYDTLVRELRKAKPAMPIVVMTLIADFRWEENFDAWIAQANVALQEIAVKYKCHVAYAHRAVGHDKGNYADIIHPNEKGAALMAESVRAAFESEAQTSVCFDLSFDHVAEARVQAYVFIPEWGEPQEGWVNITDVTRTGMTMETDVPVKIRTPATYGKDKTYAVTIKDSAGNVIVEQKVNTGWSGMLNFEVDSGEHKGPVTVDILSGMS
jgi:lysophospholipase L1-like esterase